MKVPISWATIAVLVHTGVIVISAICGYWGIIGGGESPYEKDFFIPYCWISGPLVFVISGYFAMKLAQWMYLIAGIKLVGPVLLIVVQGIIQVILGGAQYWGLVKLIAFAVGRNDCGRARAMAQPNVKPESTKIR